MKAWLLAHEPALRLAGFTAVLAAMAAWEVLAPRRSRTLPRRRRWTANLGIVILNTLALRVLFPMAAVGMALSAESHGWGLLNRGGVAPWIALAAGIVLLDLAIYLQHAMFHAVPALWRLHRVHHADLDIDVTTGARFHPVEIALSMLVKFGAIAALGVPPAAVVLFEVLLNATSMFNHANVRIAPALEPTLRWLVVTPDMHRVHHSVARDETNSNFGFNLSLWDRLFGTYRAEPRAGHAAMAIGIPDFRDPAQCNTLAGMLAIPFHGSASQPGSDNGLRLALALLKARARVLIAAARMRRWARLPNPEKR
jgi:sterol desaturase/sphingolipid hydroxylase (fatty acid hydroxylase superfamily)